MIKARRGSYTVEIALLMPMFLLVIVGTIYLSFYVHNRTYLTAAAIESAQLAVSNPSLDQEDREGLTRERSRELLSSPLFGAENLVLSVEAQESVKVSIQADTIAAYGGFKWKLTIDEKCKIVDPVAFIWKSKGMEEIIDNLRRN